MSEIKVITATVVNEQDETDAYSVVCSTGDPTELENAIEEAKSEALTRFTDNSFDAALSRTFVSVVTLPTPTQRHARFDATLPAETASEAENVTATVS